MSKKICLIAEVFLWLLLAAGNAAAVFLLWTWTVEGPPDETCLFHLLDKIAKNMVVVEGNKVTLPDGTVLTAMHEDALFEIELQNGAKKLRCVSEGEQWHCTGIQNGKKYDFSEDGKTEFHLTCGNVSAADFNYDHLMDIKTDGDTKYIFVNDQWLKCDSWELGSTKTARVPNGKIYRWTGSAWQEQPR